MPVPDGVFPNPEFERQLLQLVDEALQRPPEARAAYLTTACAGDEALRRATDEVLVRCGELEHSDEFLSGTAATYAEPLLRAMEHGALDTVTPDTSVESIASVAHALRERYRFLREIGRGGHATVHLAHDLRHDRDVAIKVIRPGHADSILPQRFLKEIAIVSQLRHPYIVPLIESGEADGVPFYVMPFIHGESLRQRLDRAGPLSLADALLVTRDVAEALDFAHRNGVVHRDIKPENILLSGSHALVADFGVALAYESVGPARMTERGIAVGTPAYMSPEQADGSGRVDPRSDVYSLACVLYEMLAGEVPYPGDSTRTILLKQMQAPTPSLAILRPALSRGVQLAVEWGLAKVPSDRPATAGELVAALEAPEGDARRPLGSPTTKNRRRLGGRVALLVVVVLLAATVWRVAWIPTRPMPPAQPEADRRRIAVLYFDNLSSDDEVGLVARGLTEDLIDELSQVRALRVISPNGVRPFRDRITPVDSVARALGVGTVIGGSVSASDALVRVSVRLVDPTNGEQRQSKAIELPRASVLDVRRAVVTNVVALLRQWLGEEVKLRQQRSETRSLAAWQEIKRADNLVSDGVDASIGAREADAADLFVRADSLYASAQRLDPTWLAPTIGRGWTAQRLALSPPHLVPFRTTGSARDVTPPGARMSLRAIAFANRALQASAGSSEALSLRGFARAWLGSMPGMPGADTLLRQGEADLRAALDDRPNDARSLYALGDLLFLDGRFAESNVALQNAYSADAFLVEVRAVVNLLFFVSLNREQFTEAGEWCRVGQQRFAGDPRFGACQLILLGWTGSRQQDVGESWHQLQALERVDSSGIYSSQWGSFRMLTAMVAARAGMRDSANAIMRAIHAGAAAHRGSSFRTVEAGVRMLLGERAAALGLLAEELREDPLVRGQVVRSPWFRAVATDSTLR